MKRTLVAIVFGSLAGCSWMYTPQKDTTGGQFQYRPGGGVVESVKPAPKAFGAASGGSAPETLYRLKILMDDGRIQYVDTDKADFTPGTRVRLTDARLIEKP
jgi:hypothetical protein